MNEEVDEHDHVKGLPTATFAMVAGICSSLFGLFAALTNGLLLFTVFKDPYNYFPVSYTHLTLPTNREV